MKAPANSASGGEGGMGVMEKKSSINPELWQACAGPVVSLPAAGTHVVYFPQGHSEQVAASMNMSRDADAQIPNYPNLPSKLLCLLLSLTLHADPETDEVYAQMTLQPVPTVEKEALVRSDLALKSGKTQPEFFCKTLTASDTSTHGGFSVPRRAAEKIFPPLDFTMQPPAQEIVARDLHDNVWTFRHIYRGQPKRHLLTTGWSLFVSGKRLFAGDSVLFIRDEKQQLLLGIRRANRQPTNLSSSVLSSDSMHIGILAAAAHAAANNSPFTVFYNPRASPSEFVIPLAKYYKAVYGNQLSLGMRFRMMFETEESGTRRYMGTITGITDLDPVRWKNSQWRNLQVGWDESSAGERRNRVSIWDIEPVTAPFFICPPPFFRSKRPRQPGMPDEDSSDLDSMFRRTMPWLGEDFGMKENQGFPGLSLIQWMNMQPSNTCSSLPNSIQTNYNMPQFSVPQNIPGSDISHQLGFSAPQQPNNLQFTPPPKLQSVLNPPQQLNDLALQHQQQQQHRHNMVSQSQGQGQGQGQILQTPTNNMILNQQMAMQSSQAQRNVPQNPISHHQSSIQQQPPDQQFQQHMDNQLHLQFLQKLTQQQQQQAPAQLAAQIPDQQRQFLPSNTQVVASQRFPRAAPPQHQPKPPQQQHVPGPHGQSGISDDVPSCSTSPPSTNNAILNHPIIIDGLEPISAAKPEVKPTVNIAARSRSHSQSQCQSQGLFAQTVAAYAGSQTEYLDTSSSTTSACLSQNEMNLPFNAHSMLFRETEAQPDPRNVVVPYGNNGIQGQLEVPLDPDKDLVGLGKDYPNTNTNNNNNNTNNNLSSGDMLGDYQNTKETQELSSSMSFGVPDMTFDSTIDHSSFLNRGPWAPAPQFQRMRSYTKVYKRGAVGRCIDITRYSGYDDLKQDLARRFGIEGQLEERQRVGWKVVYEDHENDVLLVGDDPWQEFVNCVRCIRILSPQEVQQMSLDDDFGGRSSLPNQACSSSDGGNA